MPIDVEALKLREIDRRGKFSPIQFGDIARGAVEVGQQFQAGQQKLEANQGALEDKARVRKEAQMMQTLLNGGQNALFQAIGQLEQEDQQQIFGGDANTIRSVTSTQEGLIDGWKRIAEVKARKEAGAAATHGEKVEVLGRAGLLKPKTYVEQIKPAEGAVTDNTLTDAFNQVLTSFQEGQQKSGKTLTLEERESLVLQKDSELGLGGELLASPSAKRFIDKGVRGSAKTSEASNLEDKLRNDFDKSSKQFSVARDAFSKLEAAAVDPSPAGDLALIFSFMKVNDPGSTVREGEFATAQNSGSVTDRVKSLYNRVLEGTRLTETQRKDFVKRSRLLFKTQEKTQDRNIKRFKGIAKRKGLDFRNIIQTIDPEIKSLLSDLKSGKTNISSPEVQKEIITRKQSLESKKRELEELNRKAAN